MIYHPEYLKLTKNLKKQMEDSDLTRSFASNSENLSISLKICLITAFAMNIIFQGG